MKKNKINKIEEGTDSKPVSPHSHAPPPRVMDGRKDHLLSIYYEQALPLPSLYLRTVWEGERHIGKEGRNRVG